MCREQVLAHFIGPSSSSLGVIVVVVVPSAIITIVLTAQFLIFEFNIILFNVEDGLPEQTVRLSDEGRLNLGQRFRCNE